jgi:hypothetical protein
MTDSLERIEKAFEQFRSLVEHCRNEATSDMADIQSVMADIPKISIETETEAIEIKARA